MDSIRRTCGRRPVGCYHRYAPSVHTRELIVEEGGFIYDSDAYNDDLPYFVEVGGRPHLVVPYSLVYNDSRFILAQGFGGPSDFVDLVKRAIAEYRREAKAGHPKLMSIGVHPRLFGQAGRLSALREVIEHCLELGDVWLATREQIARWFLDHRAEWGLGPPPAGGDGGAAAASPPAGEWPPAGPGSERLVPGAPQQPAPAGTAQHPKVLRGRVDGRRPPRIVEVVAAQVEPGVAPVRQAPAPAPGRRRGPLDPRRSPP